MKGDSINVGVDEFRRFAGLTITVRLSRPLRFRIWLATGLLRVAAWLAGGKATIEESQPTTHSRETP
jgi:hypothetical protein